MTMFEKCSDLVCEALSDGRFNARRMTSGQAADHITRLVLEALLEPDEQMLRAADGEVEARWGDLVGQRKPARRCWSAMIRQALSSQTETPKPTTLTITHELSEDGEVREIKP